MAKMVGIYRARKLGVSDSAWFRAVKRRELVLVCGSATRARYPYQPQASEIAHWLSVGVRVPRSILRLYPRELVAGYR